MDVPVLKAFVLCDEISNAPGGSDQKNIRGAGLAVVRAENEFPIKRSFWVYIEIADEKPTGILQLVLMRADSGRIHFFRKVQTTNPDPLKTKPIGIRLFDCVFPLAGVYFLELWYDGQWLVDQRLEVIATEGEENGV